jgi:hypothetical protein
MRKTKPTRKIAIGFKKHTRTIHWGTLKKVEAKSGDHVRVRIMHGLSDWHPACSEKYVAAVVEVPKDKPLKVTCKRCIELWGEK